MDDAEDLEQIPFNNQAREQHLQADVRMCLFPDHVQAR